MDDKFFSVVQFAEIFGITTACVRRWLLLRKISHVKLGRLVRIPGSEAERLIDAGLVPARNGQTSRRGGA